ncbi:hypothetical protein MHK_001895, partial [Candidatus Magnetomorum sp. HK-1]
LANANTPKLLITMNGSDSPAEQYAAQGFLSSWCAENTCSQVPLSLPLTLPLTILSSMHGKQIEIEFIVNSQISLSSLDTNVMGLVILSAETFDLMNPAIELPLFILSAVPVPLNFAHSTKILPLVPDDIQTSSAAYRLLSHDDIHRYAMIYHPNNRNIFLVTSLMTETDNFQRIGKGVNLDGTPNINSAPVQLMAGFPIYDDILNLFESQKGLTASRVGQALQKVQGNVDSIFYLGAEAALGSLYDSFSTLSTSCYGVGNLFNDDLLQLSADINIQLLVPAFATNRTPLETDYQNTFNAVPPFHFSTDYGYDAGLFLKALIEQQVLSQTNLDGTQLVQGAKSFVVEGITGEIGFSKEYVAFDTVMRECQTYQGCQWTITQKNILIKKDNVSESFLRKKNVLPERTQVIKRQRLFSPKIIFISPESQASSDEIGMAQQIKNGFLLAAADLPFTVVFVDSQSDTNKIKSLFYGKPHYQLTQEKIALIEQDDVPSTIIASISSIIDQNFETEDDLLDKLISLIGDDASRIHGNIIIYHAYESDGFYDQSEILSIVTIQSTQTEAISILPEKRDILILGPASDAICDARPNIINFFPGDQKVVESLEKRLLKLAKINNQVHRYISLVQSDPFQSPATHGIFHRLFSNNNLFENILYQFNGCDPRISGGCQPAIYPKWLGTIPFYEDFDEISILKFLESITDQFDHLVFLGDSNAFSKLKTALSSKPDIQKKLWSATSGLDRQSVPQLSSIESMRLQVVTLNGSSKSSDYANQFINRFGYIPGRFEDIGYDMGSFLKTIVTGLENTNKELTRANVFSFSQQMNYMNISKPQIIMPKAGQWTLPPRHDFNQDGKTDISDAVFLLKKCSAL